MMHRPKVVLCCLASFAAVFTAHACMTFVVGKKISATGRVIVGHNEDDREPLGLKQAIVGARDWPAGSRLPATAGCCATIPQVSRTLATYWAELKFAHGDDNADVFLNERGVLVVSNSGGRSREPMDDPSLLTEGGIKFNLRRCVGERATSARDAVRIITGLVERYGYAPSARIYTVADRDEAWMVQVVHGRHYVAVRCPDDQVSIMPNLYTVHELDAWPTDEILTSRGLVEHARKRGYWTGEGAFDFAAAYQGPRNWGPKRTFAHPSNDGRFPLAVRVLTGQACPIGGRYPFSVAPTQTPLDVAALKTLLCAHNEPPVDGVHLRGSWSICQVYTVSSTVCAFGETPRENELHVAAGRPCETPYRTFRPFAEGLPREIDASADADARLALHVRPAVDAPKRRVDPALLEDLLKCPSVSGHAPELAESVEIVRRWLTARGVYCVVETNEAGRAALYAATCPTKTPDYLLVSHLDVVPAPDWMFDPTFADGRVYARGACDTKGNAALCCQLLAELNARASVGLFLATDEEGGACGQKTPAMMIARGYLPKRMALVFDTAGEASGQLFVAEKGHAHIDVIAKGRGGHSSQPWALDNPIPKLFRGYLAFAEVWEAQAHGTETWRTVVSPTMLAGSEVNNVVPDVAKLHLSCRYVSASDLARVRRLLEEKTGCEVRIDPGVRPVENRPDDPEIESLCVALDRGLSGGIRLGRMNAATHAAYFAGRGFPVVILTADGGAPHSDREWGSLKSLDEYLDVLKGHFAQRQR